MMGFFAMLMRCATLFNDKSLWWVDSFCRANEAADGWWPQVDFIGMGVLKMPPVTSFGRSTSTGPGRPDVAISKASLILLGSSAKVLAMTFHLLQALLMPITSASWKAAEPIALVGT